MLCTVSCDMGPRARGEGRSGQARRVCCTPVVQPCRGKNRLSASHSLMLGVFPWAVQAGVSSAGLLGGHSPPFLALGHYGARGGAFN